MSLHATLTIALFGVVSNDTKGESAAPFPVAHNAALKATKKVIANAIDHTKLRVEFNGINGDRVPGYLYLPKNGKSPRPAILLQYGSGGNKTTDYIVAIGKQFAAAGFVVLTIDSPQRGERRQKKRRRSLLGPLNRETFKQYCGDYSRAVDYLTSRSDVDAKRIGYVGLSWGAITGVTFVANDSRIRAMVSIVGGGRFLGLLSGRKSKDPRKSQPSLDPVDYVGKIAPRPLLMVNTTKDQLMLRPFAEALHKAAGKNANVVWIETDHYFRGVDRARIVETVVIGFMKEKM